MIDFIKHKNMEMVVYYEKMLFKSQWYIEKCVFEVNKLQCVSIYTVLWAMILIWSVWISSGTYQEFLD